MMNMKLNSITTGLVLATAALSGGTESASAQPEDVLITGRIYDFKSDHPDFGLAPGSGGEVAGLLDVVLDGDGRPVFLGTGVGLAAQALDGESVAIAPHLYEPDGVGGSVVLGNSPTQKSGSYIDTYEAGTPYGGSNVGPEPTVETGATMPTIDLPTGLDSMDEIMLDGGGTTVLGSSWKLQKFNLSNGHHLQISGNVVLHVTEEFKIQNDATLTLLDGATLTVYVGKDCYIQDRCQVNMDTWDHTRLTFYNYGIQPLTIQNESGVCATFVCPNSELFVKNLSDVFGSVTAKDLMLDDNAGLHLADDATIAGGCYAQGDTQDATGSGSDGQITSLVSFGQWFNPAPGVNLSDTHQMWLTSTGSGYQFSTAKWDPIGDELYGNEGQVNNLGFTFDGQSVFEFNPCNNEYFEIETAMDAWIFIDDDLVIDLGGNTDVAHQRIQLDRLDLAPGMHRLRMFIAHRRGDSDSLRITTSLGLTPPRDIQFRMGANHD